MKPVSVKVELMAELPYWIVLDCSCVPNKVATGCMCVCKTAVDCTDRKTLFSGSVQDVQTRYCIDSRAGHGPETVA